METSLHRELKALYADDLARVEVRIGKYRIDAVVGDELIEIQHGPLTAIRDKIRKLLEDHPVRVVKPIVAAKLLVKQRRKDGRIVERRRSPKQGTIWDLFHELIHFTRVFPHPRLSLEVPLVEVEEWRYPGHGRRRWRRAGDHQVQDQRLVRIREVHHFRTAADLALLLPKDLPAPFHTGDLAKGAGIDRWVAQRVAYCLRHMGTTRLVGKKGNAWLYEFAPADKAA
jgi:hypothetical protein